jgi:DNA-binding CsgD family transcriptional regulator
MMGMIDLNRSLRVLRPEPLDDACPIGQVLARLDRPMLIIDDSLDILQANASAFAALNCPDGETSLYRYIVGDTPSQSLDMRRRIKAAILNCGRVIVPLNRGNRRLICSVKSISFNGAAGPQGLVALTPEDRPAPDVTAYLCEVYKLSKAEAEIALEASTGAEVSQIMLGRKVSIHTLRAQIASIKAKMGLSRMTEIAVAVWRVQSAALI